MMEILLKPIITEKMTSAGETFNRYGFVVNKKANKIQIKNAVEKMYGVSVEDVNTMNYKGKIKTRFTKTGMVVGSTGDVKKAVVTLSDGDAIDHYSNI
jgi:large subunit ribosomal protein L23